MCLTAQSGVAQVCCVPARTVHCPLLTPGPCPMVDLGRAVAPQLLLVSLQEAGKLEEVMQELQALRALVQEQGERIGRLEEQLSRMENGDA